MADVQDKASKGGIGEEGGTVENTNREMEGLEETTYQLAGVVSPMLPTAPANLMSKTSSLRGMKERHANAPAYTGKNENGTSTKDQEETPLNGGAGGGTPENDKEREKKKDSKRQKVAFSAPYTYATKRDYFLLIVGTFFSVAGGAMMPVFMSLFGNVINELNTTLDMNYVCSVMAGVAVASFVASWGAATCFEYTADRQAAHMKLRYFNSILRQEMAYFDVNDPGTLPTRLESNVVTMRNAIGIKLGMMAQFATTAIGGFILGFTRSWRLTLVTLSGLPLLAILGSILGYCLSNGEKGTLSKYKEAGSLSEEALLGIRTIVSLGGEQRTSKEYDKKLHEAERVGVFWSYFSSLCIGCLMGLIFLMFALGFWYGGQMVADSFEDALNGSPPPPLDSDPSTWPVPSFRGGDAITVFFAVLQACFSFGNIVPNISAYMKGAAAAEDLLALINRKSSIDPLSPDGVRDVPLTGDIRLENIVFSYPARKEKKVFNGLNLTLPAGKTIALVGTSGSGKSTIVQLLQRLYDPDEGKIFIGDTPLTDFNVKYLRAHQGIVSQEPKLFSVTIGENIALGAEAEEGEEGETKRRVSQEEIEEAAKKANAHDFISEFPSGYETDCGLFGGQLSGGQKQRIAIARAMIRKPSILILDEATSALDTVSERVVQEALDKLIEHTRATTIIVAHRLSTIRNADQIIVLDASKTESSQVVQIGNHHTLMQDKDGLYYQLVQSQIMSVETEAKVKGDDPPTVYENDLTGDSIRDQISKHLSVLSSRKSASSSVLANSGTLVMHAESSSHGQSLHPSSTHGKTGRSVVHPASTVKEEEKPLAPAYSRGREYEGEGIFKKMRRRLSTFLQIRTLSYLKPWTLLCLVALIAAVCAGALYPLFGVIFSKFTKVYFYPDPHKIRHDSGFWSLIFIALGAAQFVCEGLKFFSIEFLGLKLITLLRSKAFVQTLHQEMSFFDKQENNVGYLTGVLSSDVISMKTGSAGNAIALVQSFAAIVAGLVIAFIGDARLAAVILACLVIVIPASAAQAQISQPGARKSKGDSSGGDEKGNLLQQAEKKESVSFVMSEALNGIRIVTAYSLEPYFTQRFSQVLHKTLLADERAAFFLGFCWGFSQGAQYAVNALAFWYGGELIKNEGKDPTQIMQAIFALTFSGSSIGQTVLFSSDAGKAEKAAERVYYLIDRPSKIDSRDPGGKSLDPRTFRGHIEVERINFVYPSRPHIPVYKRLSFTMDQGETVALVGASGCGKSTLVQLLERFYDLVRDDETSVTVTKTYPTTPSLSIDQYRQNPSMKRPQGERSHRKDEDEKKKSHTPFTTEMDQGDLPKNGRITFDHTDIRDINIKSLRSLIGLVGQEPTLFSMSVEENIKYAKPDASLEEVIEVAKLANAHDFIEKFPQGYSTQVGRLGSQLSGGQKQRIAIARALLPQPRMLILDEATSALDAESERVVQATLDSIIASKDKLTLMIAHRLSTVRDADKIVVLSNEDKRGSHVVEVGTHDELMKIPDGVYRHLVNVAEGKK